MPVRIKPVQDLRPCTLNLESIKKIIDLVERDFNQKTLYSAQDGIWEIYDEPSQAFLAAVSPKEQLDSFMIHAEDSSGGLQRDLQIIFDKTQATVIFNAHPQFNHWFEDFLVELKKQLLPASFGQLMSPVFKGVPIVVTWILPLGFFQSIFTDTVSNMDFRPYTRIIIKQKIPNPLVENIKANLISNFLWAIIVFLSGIIFTIIVQQVAHGR